MSDKKHIDRLFQEKLKDFEATPNDAVWESIERELHQNKRKRRVIPLWWQIAGVASILVLIFTFGNFIFKGTDELNPNKNPFVNTEEKVNSSDTSSEPNTFSTNKPDDNEIVDDVNTDHLNPDSTTNTIHQSQINTNEIVNSKTNADKSKGAQTTNKINQALINSKNKVTIATNSKVNDNASNLPKLDKNNIDNTQNAIESDDLLVSPKTNTITSVAEINEKEVISELSEEPTNKDVQSLEEVIAEANNTDENEEREKLRRWNISTNVAPVYFNSLGDGSTLGDQFNGSSKSGEINMSYGINGSYAINNKLKIRAGINKVNLGYNTNDVIVYRGLELPLIGAFSRSNSNIAFTDAAENTSIISTQNLNFATVPEIVASNVKASINQELGFIEFPIEIEYAVLNKKLGLNVIGGFSTFLLDNNKIYSTLNGDKSLLGEAKNINDSSFSANFGLGLNYNVSNKIKFNLEPTFKYQINTFRDTSGDFQPYFIGFYTGLSYKF